MYKIKQELKKINWRSGRNKTGRITIFSKGHRVKKKEKKVLNFPKEGWFDYGSLFSMEKNSNTRNTLKGIFNSEGIYRYKLLSINQKRFNRILITNIKPWNITKYLLWGNGFKLKDIPAGLPVFNIDNKYCKASGTFGLTMPSPDNETYIKLINNKVLKFSNDKIAQVGKSSEIYSSKARYTSGYYRRLGFKGIVKGHKKNAVDHPNGGMTKILSYNRWGKLAKH